MSGKDVFPFPPDDPAVIRAKAQSLRGVGDAFGTWRDQVDGAVTSVPKALGLRATPTLINELHNLKVVLDLGYQNLQKAGSGLTIFAIALDQAHTDIQPLQTAYDTAETTFQNARVLNSGATPAATQGLQDAIDTRSTEHRRLQGLYDAALARLKRRAATSREELFAAVQDITNSPASASPDLVRLSLLDRLPFMVDPGGAGVTITRTGQHVILDTGSGNNRVKVRIDSKTGEAIVTIDGKDYRFPAADAPLLVIRLGQGNDRIEVDPSVKIGITALGGEGEDELLGGDGADRLHGGGADDTLAGGRGDDIADGDLGNDDIRDTSPWTLVPGLSLPLSGGKDLYIGGDGDDRIRSGTGDDVADGGAGDDWIETGAGNDTVRGGAGNDTIYAGEGDDKVVGGPTVDSPVATTADDDYIDGGYGNDDLDGGIGKDVVSGGRGDDRLTGGEGDDVVYTGPGRDAVTDTDGRNTVHHQTDDAVTVSPQSTKVTVQLVEVPEKIKIEGTPEFVARVRSDLDTLASSPVGQQMLERIGDEGKTLTIIERSIPDGASYYHQKGRTIELQSTGRIDILHHELSHASSEMSDNYVGRGESKAAKLYYGPDARDVPVGVDRDGDGRITFAEVDRTGDGRIDDRDLDLNNNGKTDDGWINNLERQATGLPVDHDGNPDTPDVPAGDVVDHPEALGQNTLRRELGWPGRSYTGR